MRTSIVIGLCFGDEGKGNVVSSLCRSKNDLVVRFNGGHQCGHTVVKNGYRHVFSTFGAGTLNGAPTYISQYCTFYPKAFYNEMAALIENGHRPVCYIHPLAMVTTPFDVYANQTNEANKKHGSVGVGFGATIARNEQTPFKLYAIDLTYRDLLVSKLKRIAEYYGVNDPEVMIVDFLMYVDAMMVRFGNIHDLNIEPLSKIKDDYTHIIFEGGQGVMLDMDFGFFPNVTRSNTTSKNAMQLIKDEGFGQPEVYYVMRSYLTRHGNGFMPNESEGLNFEDLTNTTHEFQGPLRQGYHSSEQIKYALKCDYIYSGNNYQRKTLVITCLDQTSDYVCVDNDVMRVSTFLKRINFPKVKVITFRSANADSNVVYETTR